MYLLLTGKGGLKAHIPQDAVGSRFNEPKGIGKGRGRIPQVLLELLLELAQIACQRLPVGRRVLAVQLLYPLALSPGVGVHVVAVVLELHQSGIRHLLYLVPGDMGIVDVLILRLGKLIGTAAKDIDHRLEAVFLQQRIGIDVIAFVSVVKGDHDGLFRQWDVVVDIGQQVGHHHGGIALLLDPFKVVLQLRGGDDVCPQQFTAFQNMMIHDDRQRDFFPGVRLDGTDRRSPGEDGGKQNSGGKGCRQESHHFGPWPMISQHSVPLPRQNM